MQPDAGFFQTDLVGDATFSIILVVGKDNAKKIDIVDLACTPTGIYELSNVFTIAQNVKIRDGKFNVRHEQVVVKGRFTEPTVAEGTIKARPKFTDAQSCGIPKKGPWTSECSLGVERTPPPEDSDGAGLTTAIGTGEEGTTIASYKRGGFETVEPTGGCAT